MSQNSLVKQKRGKVKVKEELGFFILHLLPVFAFWTGATWFDWGVCVFLYFFRMFFVTGGYHRYFSHKTYKTSRFFQFIIAFFAQTSFQKGALWWAAHHRVHHRYSDKPEDPHSKKIYGFWYSHIGWIVGPDYKKTEFDEIKDFTKFPELMWLNKNHMIPPLILAVVVYLVGGYVNGGVENMFTAGLSSLVVGFLLSTVVLFHGTFSINSLMHMFGNKRYESGDESKNNFFLALLTMGEGWHNNHHYYPSTVRQGFFWWEIDPTFYILKIFSWLGLVWDLKPVPAHIKNSRNKREAKELARKYRENSSV